MAQKNPCIYSYIDTLLAKWCEWNESFMSGGFDSEAKNLNDILGGDTSDNRSRASEMHRIGLTTIKLSDSQSALGKIRSGYNIQTQLGFLAYAIYKGRGISSKQSIQKAYESLNAIFSIIQAVEINGTPVSINTVIYALNDIYPRPSSYNPVVWNRYLLSAFFCEYDTLTRSNVLLDMIKQKRALIPLRIIDFKSKNVRATFSSSEDVEDAIKNKLSLTGIIQQKRALFIVSNEDDNPARGFYSLAYPSCDPFLKAAYDFELKQIDDNPLIAIFDEDNESREIIKDLFEIVSDDPVLNRQYQIIMKTIVEGAVDAISAIRGQLNPQSATGDIGYNRLVYGAPGTGKSWDVEENIVRNEKCYRITFHPDTDYAAFVGCYKPQTTYTNDGGQTKSTIGYGFHKQVFLEAYIEAWQQLKEGKKVFLIIEEINRGNCAQIFGDLFQLLDRRTDGFSKYTINADIDITQCLEEIADYEELFVAAYPNKKEDWKGNLMAIPSNLYIIATMNTSDQSLFPMDSAFKRRWDMVFYPIDYDDANKAKLDFGDKDNWGDVLRNINIFIKNQTESTNKTIGNRFIDFERTGDLISYTTFRDKVLFYLFNDVFKDNEDFAKSFFGDKYGVDHRFFEDLCVDNDPTITVDFLKRINPTSIQQETGE